MLRLERKNNGIIFFKPIEFDKPPLSQNFAHQSVRKSFKKISGRAENQFEI
jgi:hypothetical protein